MEWTALGLSRRPFRAGPDPSAYVPLAGHESALADWRDALESGDDGALLVGESGLGKTLLVHRFLDSLPDDQPTMLLPGAKYAKPVDLYQAMAFDLGKPWQGVTESEMRLTITDHLLGELTRNHTLAMAIDDAHHLSVDVLEELRLLGNLAGSGRRATFILLAGLPSLVDRLNTPWLVAAAERYRARPSLQPLTPEETRTYLWQQLEAAGSRDPDRIIDDEAAMMIAERTSGVPRRINHLAGTALQLARSGDLDRVDCEAILEAAERLGYASPLDESSQSLPSDKSEQVTLTIPPVVRESTPARAPKLRAARRQSA
jgi:type II secretory pathway predicted ATPase ExeA